MANTARSNIERPNYVMRKTAWSVVRPWHILLGFLIVPLIIMIVKIINIKDETISFYNNRVVVRSGIFSKHERTNILTRVLSVTVKQTFWGRIFNYVTVQVDVVGKWDINMRGVKDPMAAKAYLERFVPNGRRMNQIITD